MTIVFDVLQESTETFFPPVGIRIPTPAWQVFKSALAVRVKGAVGVFVALRVDPFAKLVAIDGIGHRDPSVVVIFDVVPESGEAILPFVDADVPRPTGEFLDS